MLPASSFSCSFTGTCSGSPLFAQLQQQLNRVRPIYGLPADVAVDGKIGLKTLAKLIKTAQAIDRKLGEARDSALDDYAFPDISGVTTKQLASEADIVLAALRRNGYSIGRVPPDVAAQSVLDPYVANAGSGVIPNKVAPIGPLIVHVGPTAPTTPLAPTAPTLRVPMGLKIAGGAMLALGVAGGIAAIVAGVKNR